MMIIPYDLQSSDGIFIYNAGHTLLTSHTLREAAWENWLEMSKEDRDVVISLLCLATTKRRASRTMRTLASEPAKLIKEING